MEDWLAARARTTPRALALIAGSGRWSYGELNELVDGCSRRLSSLVRPGAHVALLLPNGLEFVCLIHAAARAGNILVPLNTRLTGRELLWQLDHSNAALLITTGELAENLAGTSGAARRVLLVEELFLPLESREWDLLPDFRLERTQAIIYTSGTTGQPKGAMLTFANHLWSATSSAFRLGVANDDRWLCCLPLYHVGGMAIIFRSCLYGTAVVLHESFVESEIAQSLQQSAVTLISLVPTMVQRLLDHFGPQPWPAALRHVLMGGAAAAPELFARCHDLAIPLSVTYGLSEAASQVATMLPRDSKQKPGSVGRPLLFTNVAILDSDDRPMAAGEIGEICVEGPTIMSGYYRDDLSTQDTLRNGRLHTGDMGYFDADGDLWPVQRRDDIIVSGGENVYPAEVENVLCQHPAVAAICVSGVPDAQWGQRVAVMVELKPGADLTSADLLAFARQRLAGYKLPRQVHFVDRLPLTASGKIHRQKVGETLSAQRIHLSPQDCEDTPGSA